MGIYEIPDAGNWCPYHPDYDPREGKPHEIKGSNSEYDAYCTICWGAFNCLQVIFALVNKKEEPREAKAREE